ncbi:MAG TPA: hypothetical protein VNF07_10900 [Acidimicrobiales bacterium]|nr:hypothetical protein [Acidimicrobiales bacterium]
MAGFPGGVAGAEGQIFESARPLSQSVLWRAQNRYYEGAGQQAWASGEVPHTLTTGPILARSYARLIESFVADCRAGVMGPVDPAAPLYVVEVGSGSGRLAFEVLLALDREALAPFHVVYVLTDRVAENIASYPAHPMLAPLIAAGEVDWAYFEAGTSTALRREGSGAPLDEVVNPLVLVANYLFDVIPQDLFTTAGGALREELVTTCAETPFPELGDPDFFRRVFLSTTPVEVPPGRYEEARIDGLLRECAAARPEGRFLFPADALRTLDTFLRLSGGRLLCLIGERPGRVPLANPEASAVDEAIKADPAVRPGPAVLPAGGATAHRPGALIAMGVHGGSMSLPVDLSILARAAAPRRVLLPEAPPTALLVAALCFGEEAPAAALRRCYARVVGEAGPEDIYLLVKAALGEGERRPVHAEHLAVLRLGGYDPYLLRLSVDGFAKEDDVLDDAELEELARVLGRTWLHDFPIDDTDLAYGIAAILAPAGAYAAALEYFGRSIERTGPRANTWYNAALCELHLGRVEDAITSLRSALALDAAYEPAETLLEQVLGEQERDRARAAGDTPDGGALPSALR